MSDERETDFAVKVATEIAGQAKVSRTRRPSWPPKSRSATAIFETVCDGAGPESASLAPMANDHFVAQTYLKHFGDPQSRVCCRILPPIASATSTGGHPREPQEPRYRAPHAGGGEVALPCALAPSIETFKKFAGPDPEVAIIEPEGRAGLTEVDEFATHYDVALVAVRNA